MRRTTTLSVAGLLGLALLIPTASATAAGETCRGEAATIVGTGSTVTGTEGRDVIVTGRAIDVHALGGDDLVCVTPRSTGTNVADVDAGTGDDVVDTSGAPGTYYVTVILGAGADTFVGGPSSDRVTTGDLATEGIDADRDDVRTGGGGDQVTTGTSVPTGAVEAPNRDVVDTGTDADQVVLVTWSTAPDGLVTGGEGRDTLVTTTVPVQVEVFADMTGGTLHGIANHRLDEDGVAAHFSSFEGLDLDIYDEALVYRGTTGSDSLHLSGHRAFQPHLDADLLGGDDLLVLEGVPLASPSLIDAGTGDDEVIAAQKDGSLELNLGYYKRYVVDGVRAASVAGLEDAFLLAPEVTMVGSNADNDLAFAGCRATLSGGHGRDTLANVHDYWFESYTFDCRARATINGGPDRDRLRGGQGRDLLRGEGGNDVLEGRGGNDVLLGGGGRDTADGGKGRDRCVAERERRCER